MYLHEVPTQVFHHISFWVSVSQSSFDGDCLGGELLFYGNWLRSTGIPYDLVCFFGLGHSFLHVGKCPALCCSPSHFQCLLP